MPLLIQPFMRCGISCRRFNSTPIQSLCPRRRTAAQPTKRHHPRHQPHARSASPEGDNQEEENPDLAAARQSLESMMSQDNSMTGTELRELVFNKFNRSYDVRIQKRGRRTYLHIMWKHLEQKSFALTEEEYQMQLDAVAEYLTMWGVVDIVRQGIASAKYAPGSTLGGGARAVSIPLGVEIDGGRSGEWNSF